MVTAIHSSEAVIENAAVPVAPPVPQFFHAAPPEPVPLLFSSTVIPVWPEG